MKPSSQYLNIYINMWERRIGHFAAPLPCCDWTGRFPCDYKLHQKLKSHMVGLAVWSEDKEDVVVINEARIAIKESEWISFEEEINEENKEKKDDQDDEEVRKLTSTKPKLKRTVPTTEEILKSPLINLSTPISSVSTPCQDENSLNFMENPIQKKKKRTSSDDTTYPLMNLSTPVSAFSTQSQKKHSDKHQEKNKNKEDKKDIFLYHYVWYTYPNPFTYLWVRTICAKPDCAI